MTVLILLFFRYEQPQFGEVQNGDVGQEAQIGGYDQSQNQQLVESYDYQSQQVGGYDQQLQHEDPSQASSYDQYSSGDQIERPSQLENQAPPDATGGPLTFFNPAEINSVEGVTPTFFNPSALPAIPEQGNRSSPLSRQGSLSGPSPSAAPPLSRQSSLGPRSRQGSESIDNSSPSNLYNGLNENQPAPPEKSPEKEKSALKPSKKTDGPSPVPKKSWIGGIFSKVFKSDQIHLPDDKDKKIVFDEAKGRWVNLDGDDDDLAPAAPPPKDPAFSVPTATTLSGPAAFGGGPPVAPTSFRAGLGSRRGRSGYVDVLGQAGLSKPMANPMLPNGGPGGGPPVGTSPPTMFNPNIAPISGDGPTSLDTGSNNPYMVPDKGGDDEGVSSSGPASMPMMFNPSAMSGTGTEQPPGF